MIQYNKVEYNSSNNQTTIGITIKNYNIGSSIKNVKII